MSANPYIGARVGFDTERSLAATSFNGSYQAIGTPLSFNPIIIIFDNQTDVSVPISIDGTNVWKTFSAGEAFVWDLRANAAHASTYTIDLQTQFYTNAALGTSGSMRISINYAR